MKKVGGVEGNAIKRLVRSGEGGGEFLEKIHRMNCTIG